MANIKEQDRFWNKVNKGNENECWEWVAGLDTPGYGIFYPTRRRPIHASRYSWEIHNGEIPENICVLHKCDNPPCVNPNHLFLGTKKDNYQDMVTKGRQVVLRGEESPKSKLKEDDIRSIRQMYKSEKMTQKQLANLFGVTRGLIGHIIQGRIWNYI